MADPQSVADADIRFRTIDRSQAVAAPLDKLLPPNTPHALSSPSSTHSISHPSTKPSKHAKDIREHPSSILTLDGRIMPLNASSAVRSGSEYRCER